MRALFVIFALAIGSASADPLLVYPCGTGSPGQTFAPVVLRAPLVTSGTGCIAALTGSFGEAITCTRASTATVVVGSETTCSANVCRIAANGLLSEVARTNSYLNSDAPATQTITYATGNQYAWVTGAGNIALAVGTATATGLPCTATAASPCLFNVTVGGTVVATYTATLTFVQIENGTYKTSAIHTAGTAVSRAADAVSMASVTRGGGDASFSFDVCFEGASTAYSSIFPTQIDIEGVSNQVFRVAWDNSANWNCIARGTGDAGQVVVATLADSWSAGACRHIIGSWDTTQKKLTCTVKNGGSTVGSETTPATTNIISDIATLYLGKDNNNAGRETGGNIANECFSVAQSANGGCT